MVVGQWTSNLKYRVASLQWFLSTLERCIIYPSWNMCIDHICFLNRILVHLGIKESLFSHGFYIFGFLGFWSEDLKVFYLYIKGLSKTIGMKSLKWMVCWMYVYPGGIMYQLCSCGGKRLFYFEWIFSYCFWALFYYY